MRPLAGNRINRINLEPITGSVSSILQPFVFDIEEKIYPVMSISPIWKGKLVIRNKGSKLNLISR
jgi:hypothetical protein